MSDNLNLEEIISFDNEDDILDIATAEEIGDDANHIDDKEGKKEEAIDKTDEIEEELIDVTPASATAPVSEENEDLAKIYGLLKESDLLQVPEEFVFEPTPEKLEEALDHTFSSMQKLAQDTLLDKLSEDDKLALRFALQGGGSFKDFYEEFQVERGWADVDVEDEESQEAVVSQYLKQTTRYSDTKIEATVNELKKTGRLEKEAKENLVELIALEEEALQKREAALAEREVKIREAKLQERKEIESLVDKMPLEPERASKLKGFLNNEMNVRKGYPSLTHFLYTLRQIGQNKEHLVQLADILIDYTPEKGLSLDRIENKIKASTTSKLREKIDAIAVIPNSQDRKNKTPKETKFDWDKWARNF